MAKQKSRKKSSKKKKPVKALLLLGIAFLILIMAAVYGLWRTAYKPAIKAELPNDGYFYIATGETYGDVIERFERKKIVDDMPLLKWTFEQKNYPDNIKAGRYKFTPKMSLIDIANMLRSGEQAPIDLILRSQNNFEELAEVIHPFFESSSDDFKSYFKKIQRLGYGDYIGDKVFTYVLPNTYQFFWNTTPEEFMKRMVVEHNKFWSKKNRRSKAAAIDMSTADVQIMASIVQKESNKKDEQSTIAGVYYNRLQKRMLLQADPTLVFALKEEGITRVLNKDKRIDSPYNTYINPGLPPGPICMASFTTIDAVLNLEKHNYLYFCAREDFSGYHSFAETYAGHLINARRYQRALNQRKIYR